MRSEVKLDHRVIILMTTTDTLVFDLKRVLISTKLLMNPEGRVLGFFFLSLPHFPNEETESSGSFGTLFT